MIIQIKNGQGEVITTIRDFFGMSMSEELNGVGSFTLSAPATDLIRKSVIRRGYRVEVYYYVDILQQPLLFSGYVNEYKITKDAIELHAYNWISYLQHRIVRNACRYDHKSVAYIINDLYSQANTIHSLPFSLHCEDIRDEISLHIDKGATLFDALETVYEARGGLQYRVTGSHEGGMVLEVGKQVGKLLDGVWIYDESATNKANIQGRQRKETTTGYWNYMMSKNGMHTKEAIDEEDVNEVGLLFERYANDQNTNARVSTRQPVVPSIEVMADQERWNMKVGDRREVRLLTGYDQVQLSYEALIQSKKISIGTGGVHVQIQISDQYMKQTNILDAVLTNLKKDIKKS